ncbi:MAG: nitrogen fixation protein NifQ [Burkholderiaceae bacterium]|nr:nitrogen fixation protein NifQ [Burkholderiaceae bacterium]
MSKHEQGYVELIEAALHPDHVVTLAFAGVIALAPQREAPYDVAIAGLDGKAMAALRERYFPDLPFGFDADSLWREEAHDAFDEFDDLLAMLLENRSFDDQESLWLAHALATASMGQNHLWQDLGLPNRATLSWLMKHHFTSLAERNTGNMKWKKFFYRQLCERADLFVCKSPNCRACNDYAQCFNIEDGAALTGLDGEQRKAG